MILDAASLSLKEYRSCSGGLTHAHYAGQPASRDLVVARQKLDSRSLGGSAYCLDSESMKEQICPKEYRSCSGGSTHAHCAGKQRRDQRRLQTPVARMAHPVFGLEPPSSSVRSTRSESERDSQPERKSTHAAVTPPDDAASALEASVIQVAVSARSRH